MVFGLGRLFLWSSFLVLFVLNVGVVVVAVDAGGEDNDDEDTFDDLDELIDEFYEVQLKILDHIESQHAHSGLHNEQANIQRQRMKDPKYKEMNRDQMRYVYQTPRAQEMLRDQIDRLLDVYNHKNGDDDDNYHYGNRDL